MSIKIDKRNTNFVTVIILFGLLVVGSIFFITNNSFMSTINAQKQGNQQFNANLTGNEEVPPTNIISIGKAKFQVDSQTNNTAFSLNVKDLEGITATHIHNGTKGLNGPVIVTLFTSPSPSSEDSNSLSINGTIINDNLEGPLAGKQVSDLIGLMNNKSSYVNVHTEQNPLGAIRGQIGHE
ncbi:MAG: CHRD domain-containing protein [Nitrosopumilus sp.]|nr:CHRD domain-containing protein [Nitrosopumilus sp.]